MTGGFFCSLPWGRSFAGHRPFAVTGHAARDFLCRLARQLLWQDQVEHDGDQGCRQDAGGGQNLERLKEIKAKFDPNNIFWFEQSIGPKPVRKDKDASDQSKDDTNSEEVVA